MALLAGIADSWKDSRKLSKFNSEWGSWERFMRSKRSAGVGQAAGTVARSSGGRRFRRYAIRGGIAAGAVGAAYGIGKSSGVQGITSQSSGAGGYPTGMYGM